MLPSVAIDSGSWTALSSFALTLRARIAAKSILCPVPSQSGQLSRSCPRLQWHGCPVFGWYSIGAPLDSLGLSKNSPEFTYCSQCRPAPASGVGPEYKNLIIGQCSYIIWCDSHIFSLLPLTFQSSPSINPRLNLIYSHHAVMAINNLAHAIFHAPILTIIASSTGSSCSTSCSG